MRIVNPVLILNKQITKLNEQIRLAKSKHHHRQAKELEIQLHQLTEKAREMSRKMLAK